MPTLPRPLLLALLGLLSLPAAAATPAISIVIDDMGDRVAEGRQVIALPGAVACAILPGTPHGAALARAAHVQGKEVMLHFPLQPLEGKAHPMAITVRSDRNELARRLREDLDSLPFLSGINTHQGSLLSQRLQPMHWLMAELRTRGNLYFIDSYTTSRSVALSAAQNWGLASTRRDVFLDDTRGIAEIRTQFLRMIALAKRDGSALGIGHPYGETLTVLQQELPKLAQYGVRLIAPSELIRLRSSRAPAQPEFRPLLLKFSPTLALSDTSPPP